MREAKNIHVLSQLVDEQVGIDWVVGVVFTSLLAIRR